MQHGVLVTRSTFTRAGTKGANGFTSSTRALSIERYRVAAVPVDGKRSGKTVTKTFRIARR